MLRKPVSTAVGNTQPSTPTSSSASLATPPPWACRSRRSAGSSCPWKEPAPADRRGRGSCPDLRLGGYAGGDGGEAPGVSSLVLVERVRLSFDEWRFELCFKRRHILLDFDESNSTQLDHQPGRQPDRGHAHAAPPSRGPGGRRCVVVDKRVRGAERARVSLRRSSPLLTIKGVGPNALLEQAELHVRCSVSVPTSLMVTMGMISRSKSSARSVDSTGSRFRSTTTRSPLASTRKAGRVA